MTPCDIQQRVSAPWRGLGLSPHYFRGQRFVGYTVGDVCVCGGGWKEDRRHAREMHGKNYLKQGDLKMEKR